jgi:fructose-bisphosphate aldolase class II
VPLVLHGSSGVPDGELRRGVAAGLTKVNIGTALNAAFTAALRDRLAARPATPDPRPALAAARDAMTATALALLAALAGGGPGGDSPGGPQRVTDPARPSPGRSARDP